ncbi:MAG: metal ABC transporter permease, partial [Clostridiales bacterium]|nr:metal ABC transporter permease [Clostridiales bacterium]
MDIFKTLGEYLQFPFVQYALVVGVLTALSASLIGVPLVLKRYSFIGDGLSHVAFGGMAIAAVINLTNDLYFILPVTVAVAVLLLGRGNNTKIKGDAAIAVISVGALAFGYFLLNTFSASANISGDVCSSLFGSVSILTLSYSDVWLCIAMSVAVIGLYLVFYNKIFAVTFDSDFMRATGGKSKAYELLIAVVIAVVVSLAMRLVGSLLTSALIIFPALSAMRIFKSFKSVVICSAVISGLCAALGMLVSILWGTPVGATIVMADICVFIL